MNPNDYSKGEPGIQDATFQDFVAPLLLGLGVAPKLASMNAPAIARGLSVAPAIEKTVENRGMSWDRVEELLTKFLNSAQEMGDFARVFKYKALRSMMEQNQMAPNEVLSKIQKIHFQ
jgi:hypothetical protein